MEKIKDQKTRQIVEDTESFGSLGEAGDFMCDDVLANTVEILPVCQ